MVADSIKVFRRHNNGLLPEIFSSRVQYKKLQTKNFFINADSLCDRCVILTDGSVCIVRNIIVVYNVYYLVLNKFQIVEDLYNVAIPSSALGVYVCSALNGTEPEASELLWARDYAATGKMEKGHQTERHILYWLNVIYSK